MSNNSTTNNSKATNHNKPNMNEIKPGQFVLMEDKMNTPIKAFILYKSGSSINPTYDYIIPTNSINYNDITKLSIWNEGLSKGGNYYNLSRKMGGKNKRYTKRKY